MVRLFPWQILQEIQKFSKFVNLFFFRSVKVNLGVPLHLFNDNNDDNNYNHNDDNNDILYY